MVHRGPEKGRSEGRMKGAAARRHVSRYQSLCLESDAGMDRFNLLDPVRSQQMGVASLSKLVPWKSRTYACFGVFSRAFSSGRKISSGVRPLPRPDLILTGGSRRVVCKTRPNVRVSSNLLVKLRNDGRCKEGDVHVADLL